MIEEVRRSVPYLLATANASSDELAAEEVSGRGYLRRNLGTLTLITSGLAAIGAAVVIRGRVR